MRVMLIAAALLVASCKNERPPQPTAEQSQQLNEAEDMLNNMAENGTRNEEGPEQRPGPSNSSD